MKTLLTYILFLVFCTNCQAQNNKQKNSQMKKFDIETFEKNKDHLNEYSFITKDSTIIEQNQWQFGYEEVVKPKNAHIYTYNKYYNNGTLKITGDFYPEDFEKGIWEEYNEQGKVIEKTNYDIPYKYTWEDILAFIHKRKLDMNAYGFRIVRGANENGTAWSITYNKSEEDMILGIIIIDGKSGQIIKEFEEPYPIEE